MASIAVLMGPLLVLVCIALVYVHIQLFTKNQLTCSPAVHSLFGIFTAQVYYYWTTYDKDSKFVRLFVLIVW